MSAALRELDRRILLVHFALVELSNHHLFNAFIARVLQYDELMRDDPVRYLFLLPVVKLVGLRHLVHHGLASILLLIDFVDDRRYVHFLVAAGERVVGAKRTSE